MASFSVVLKPSAEKDLRSLTKPLAKRLWAKIEALSTEPLPRQSVKLAGAEHLYRVRVGDHRIIYGLDNAARQVVIHYVRHRNEAYRQV